MLHQGPERWRVSVSFEDLFDLPGEIAGDLLPWLPKFRYALLDLSRYDPASGEDDTRQRVVLQLMKLTRQRQLLAYFRWLAEPLPDSELHAKEIYRSLTADPELEEQAMSVAEKLIAKCRAGGLEKGLQTGLQESVPDALAVRFGEFPKG